MGHAARRGERSCTHNFSQKTCKINVNLETWTWRMVQGGGGDDSNNGFKQMRCGWVDWVCLVQGRVRL
jgi:hypothetical protein